MKYFNLTASSIDVKAGSQPGQIEVLAKMDKDDYSKTIQQISFDDFVEGTDTEYLLEAIPTNRISGYLEDMGLKIEMDENWIKVTPQTEEHIKEGYYLFRVEFGKDFACFLIGRYYRVHNLCSELAFEFLHSDEVSRLIRRTGQQPRITHYRCLDN